MDTYYMGIVVWRGKPSCDRGDSFRFIFKATMFIYADARWQNGFFFKRTPAAFGGGEFEGRSS
ncbi:MAG: hypothetical protein VX017_10605, partial [Pseudomonadota bacterium]|nr:hypothetical protein [Pseudomonadota bacterium]